MPMSDSNYQYQSVQKENLANIYRKDNSTFFSFIFVLPILAIIAVFVIIFSIHDSIEEKMKKKDQHKNFAAVIGLGLNIAAYITALDIWGLCWFTEEEHGGSAIYFSKEDTKYNTLRVILILHVVVESIIYGLGEIWFLILCVPKKLKAFIHKSWWTLLILFIPPIWCLASHFGFIVIAWSSFVRRGKALTLVYVIGATVMFIVMRQTYKLIDKRGRDKKGSNKEQEKDGISFKIIQVVRVVGLILVGGVFFYIMYGLWLVPVSETVEESPVYLYDSLNLIIVVLAFLVSYEISFGDDEVVELLKEIKVMLKSRIQDNKIPSNDEAVYQEDRDEDLGSGATPTTCSTPSPSRSLSTMLKSCCSCIQDRTGRENLISMSNLEENENIRGKQGENLEEDENRRETNIDT